jgi:hypothetical protein
MATRTWRSEGLTFNRPGRRAGNRIVDEMIAEAATHSAVPHLRCSSDAQSYPGLTAGPNIYRSFGPNQVLHPIVTIKRDIHK